MAKRCIDGDEDGWHKFLPVCLVVFILQLLPMQVGVAALDLICDGAPRVQSREFQGESPRSDLHWLYMALPKALFWDLRLISW
jgi:hypothetical protein